MADDTQGLPADAGQGDGAGADSGNGQESNQGDNGQGEAQGEQNAQSGEGEGTEGQQQQAAPTLTPEQIEERAFQRTASWTGRELRKFQDNILGEIGRQVSQLRQPPTQPVPPPSGNIDAATLLEKPGEVLGQFVRREDIPKILAETNERQTQETKNYNLTLVQQAAAMMGEDPLFTDKELGAEVVEEIQKSFASVDRRLPPNVAAQLLLNGAVTNVVRKRAATKTNAFAGKVPVGKGQGTVGAPAPTPPKAPQIKLDPMAARIAAMFGNSEKDASELLSKR